MVLYKVFILSINSNLIIISNMGFVVLSKSIWHLLQSFFICIELINPGSIIRFTTGALVLKNEY